MKIVKSLYRIKRYPKAWFKKFTWSVKRQGFMHAQSDHTLFMRFSNDGKIVILILYVDDVILI